MVYFLQKQVRVPKEGEERRIAKRTKSIAANQANVEAEAKKTTKIWKTIGNRVIYSSNFSLIALAIFVKASSTLVELLADVSRKIKLREAANSAA